MKGFHEHCAYAWHQGIWPSHANNLDCAFSKKQFWDLEWRECPFLPPSFPSTKLRDLSSHFKLEVFFVAMKLLDNLGDENNTKFSLYFLFSHWFLYLSSIISPLYFYSLNFCCDIALFCMKNCVDIFFTWAKVLPNLIKIMVHLVTFSSVSVSLL